MSQRASESSMLSEPPTETHRARAYLLRVAEPPAPALVALVAECGPIAAAELVRGGTASEKVLEETAARRHLDLVDEDLAAAARVNARLVIPEDDEWPAWQLLALEHAGHRLRWATPPLALWVRGTAKLAEAVDSAVSVVGARAATGYGEHVAAEFGHGLAALGYTVVSGAAYGKELTAVPGPITSAASIGCHELLRSGTAIPVTSVAEIVESVGRVGDDLAPRPHSPVRRTDNLGEVALRVHEALGRGTGQS